MLAFITTLRHPDNAESYERVESLLEATLASITAQTVDNFIVIVVGHQPPGFLLPPNTVFVPVDFPAPVAENGPHAGREAFVWDKGTKIGVGLLAARSHNPDRVMIFDADDFVSRDLVEFSQGQPGEFGWMIRHGLMYSQSRNAYRHITGFNRTCGTCAIVPFSAYAVPAELGVDATQDQIGEAFGERLWRILGAHREADEWFAAHDVAMYDLPFPGAVYHVDTGENHSGKALAGLAHPLSARVCDQFGIRASRGAPGTLWSAFGPVAVLETMLEKLRRLRERWAKKDPAGP